MSCLYACFLVLIPFRFWGDGRVGAGVDLASHREGQRIRMRALFLNGRSSGGPVLATHEPAGAARKTVLLND